MFQLTLKKLIISLTAAAVAVGAILIILENNKKNNQVCFKNNCFEVELAVTPEQQAKGLMSRENLDPKAGMLFIFSKEGDYPFWMKNTKISLDIIWINQNKEVVFISENTPPCKEDPCLSINPNKNAMYVLEINGGAAKKINLLTDDKVDIKISIPKQAIF